MTVKQITLVKRSWNLFSRIDPVLIGDVFYSRLFLKAPGLKKMFGASMEDQYKKLFDMLTTMVARLERIEELKADIKELAIRHLSYGIKEWHYQCVGESLLWTLEQGLGNDWNDETKNAWLACYELISNSMINAGSIVKT